MVMPGYAPRAKNPAKGVVAMSTIATVFVVGALVAIAIVANTSNELMVVLLVLAGFPFSIAALVLAIVATTKSGGLPTGTRVWAIILIFGAAGALIFACACLPRVFQDIATFGSDLFTCGITIMYSEGGIHCWDS